MRSLRMSLFAVLPAAAVVLNGCSPPTVDAAEGDERVTLSIVSGFPTTHSNNDGLWMFQERLEENAPWIELDFKGGPELMDPTLLVEGASSGAFDAVSLPGDYYVDQLPAMEIPRFTPYTPMEEREEGILDIYDRIHRDQLGVTYLGRSVSGMPQVLLVTSPMETPDLAGRSIRTSSAMSAFVRHINGVPVDLPGDEVYTAIERGVVSGATWASVGPSSLGLEEVVAYDLAPRFYESVANIVINEDTWDSLDEETQRALEYTMAEVEPEIFTHYLETSQAETAEWRAAGVEQNELAGPEAERLMEIAYRDGWEELDWDTILVTTPDAADLKAEYEAGLEGDLFDVVPGGSDIDETEEIGEEVSDEYVAD